METPTPIARGAALEAAVRVIDAVTRLVEATARLAVALHPFVPVLVMFLG